VEPEGSLPCSQETPIGPYSKPDVSNPQLPTLFLKDPFSYYSPIYVYIFQVVSSRQVSPTKILYTFLICHACYITRPSHPPWFDHRDIEAFNSWSWSLCGLLQPPAISYLLGPNILLSTLVSNISVCVLTLVWEVIKFHTHTKQQVKVC
jgi:hypothetical protein